MSAPPLPSSTGEDEPGFPGGLLGPRGCPGPPASLPRGPGGAVRGRRSGPGLGPEKPRPAPSSAPRGGSWEPGAAAAALRHAGGCRAPGVEGGAREAHRGPRPGPLSA